MPYFSKRSKDILATCHLELQRLFNEVIKYRDCTPTCGFRNEQEQNEAYNATPQRSKFKWPNSKHNQQPSIAIDVMPYPIDYKDKDRILLFAGFVLGIASQLGISIRYGGDWDNDGNPKDGWDFPHYELFNKDK